MRDVVSELDIPGVRSGPPISWGIPEHRHSRASAASATTRKGRTSTTTTPSSSSTTSVGRGAITAFRFGGEIRWDQYNQVGNQFARGAFLFEANATVEPRRSRHRQCVCRLPARLLQALRGVGFAGRGAVPRHQPVLLHRRHLEDHPKLTLNLGLRYEYTPPWLDKTGRLVNIHVPFFDNTPNVAGPQPPSGLRPDGQRRFLRGPGVALQSGDQGGARRAAGRAAGSDRPERLRAALRHRLEPDQQVDGAAGRRRVLLAGYRQSALRHGAQPGRPAARRSDADADSI